MLIRFKYFLVLMLLSISLLINAQQTHTSPYSYIGLGDIYNSGLTYNRSLGGMGIGTRSSYYLNGVNPAALSAMDTMSFTFEFGASGVYNILETATLKEPSYNGSIDYIALGFPITRWMKTSVGFSPFSKVGYSLSEEVKAYDDQNNELFSLNREIKGEGGLNKVYLSNSVMFLKKFSVGLTVSYIFGQRENSIVDTPEGTNSSVSGYSELIHKNISDFTYSFGFQYHDTISKNLKYTIGAISGLGSKLKENMNVTMRSYSTGHPSDTLLHQDNIYSNIKLPAFFGVGFSVKGEKLMYGIDYEHTFWNNVSVEGQTEYADAKRIVMGMEYIPKQRTATKYYQRIRYRLATKYEMSYMKINSKQLKDAGITFGIGLPMKRSKSTLNLSFDIGRRGTFNSDVLTQTYFKFNIDLSMHDIWFIKRKYD